MNKAQKVGPVLPNTWNGCRMNGTIPLLPFMTVVVGWGGHGSRTPSSSSSSHERRLSTFARYKTGDATFQPFHSFLSLRERSSFRSITTTLRPPSSSPINEKENNDNNTHTMPGQQPVPHPGTLHDETQIHHSQPGLQRPMQTQPVSSDLPDETQDCTSSEYPPMTPYKPAGKLTSQVALITGGDSGIGRAVAVLFAKEGAHVAIVYVPKEETDAQDTKRLVEQEGKQCLLIEANVGAYEQCQWIVQKTVDQYGKLDILVNNASVQYIVKDIADMKPDQIEETFRTNALGYLFMAKAALQHMKKGSKIINTTSVVAYRGSPSLLDYSMTKGAEVALTRSLAQQLAGKGIRVNSVAPGPIVTPLQAVSRDKKNYESFMEGEPLLGRVGQPSECATCYVFLASNDSSYMTGQCLHPNGGDIING